MSATETTRRPRPGADRPVPDRRRRDRQPRAARAAGRDRQLVRAPAGAPPRRRARGLGDGLQPRDPPPQRAHAARAARRSTRTSTRSRCSCSAPIPEVMREAAAVVADAGADLIDLNMGCPVRKVRKTGAGAELLADPDLAVAVAARRGRGRPRQAGDREAALRAASGRRLRRRPRRAARRGGRRRRDRLPPALGATSATRATPDYDARPRAGRADRRAGDRLRRPRHAPRAPAAPTSSPGADAVMIARGSLRLPVDLRGADRRARASRRRAEEIADELLWVVDRAEEHLGERARVPLPAQVLPLVRWSGSGSTAARRTPSSASTDLDEAREMIAGAVA